MKFCVSLLSRAVAVVTLFSAVAGCAGSIDPGAVTGSGGTGVASCGGASGTSTLATFANVKDVVNNTCFGSDCHIQGDQQPYLLALGAAPMADADLYNKLTTYKTTLCGGRMLV